MSTLPFDVAAGSVQGREHARAGRNNQDAVCVRGSEHGLVAVVADGCGSQPCSELGAQLGVRRLAQAAQARLARGEVGGRRGVPPGAARGPAGACWRASRGAGPGACWEDLLFTIVGAVVTPAHTLVFSSGDGVWMLNGEVHALGPFPGNAPPYLAYALLRGEDVPLERRALVPTDDVHALLVGTDGVGDLLRLSRGAAAGARRARGPAVAVLDGRPLLHATRTRCDGGWRSSTASRCARTSRSGDCCARRGC